MKLLDISLLFLIAFSTNCYLSGQDSNGIASVEDVPDQLDEEILPIRGFWDYALPVTLFINPQQPECMGTLQFGDSSDLIQVEGHCHDTLIQLYEFDDHARVTGVLEGRINDTDFEFTWSNADNSINYDFSGSRKNNEPGSLQVFTIKGESAFDGLILWPHRNKIYVVQEESDILYWRDYTCPHASYACQYDAGNDKTKNLSISTRMVSAGSRLFEFEEEIEVQDRNGHGFNYFYNYSYPQLEDSKFNRFIIDQIDKYQNNFLNNLPELDEFGPEERLKNKAWGDFCLTLITGEIVSGYLTFNSTLQQRLETVAFSYDRVKKKFYRIQDIWEKDFDYMFYLKKTLNNKKRTLVQSEEPLVRDILKEQPFAHFVMSAKGILFFTDYNFMYGRRLVLLPYNEIAGFIRDRGLSNLINQKT